MGLGCSHLRRQDLTPAQLMGAAASFERQDLTPAVLGELTAEESRVLDHANGIDTDVIEQGWGEEDGNEGAVFMWECLGEQMPSTLDAIEIGTAMGLSLANNSLSIEKGLPWSNTLRILNFGGNCVSVPDLTQKLLPAQTNLLVLDLSHTEGIQLGHGFAGSTSCITLLRLVLDDCALSSTTSEQQGQSLFLGLSRLRELSLRENCLEDIESLGGLACLHCSLSSLALEDNPCVDTAAGLERVRGLALAHLPLLTTLDRRPLRDQPSDSKVEVVLARVDGGSSAVGGLGEGKGGLDQMEKEYLAALKQERDVTVVS